jgi:tape measure domain-containing protein
VADTQIKITADASQALRSVQDIQRSLGGLNTTATSLNRTMSGLANTLVASLSVAAVTRAGDAYTQFGNQLKSVSGSQAELSTAMSEVQRIANETGTPLQQVGQLYTRLSVAGQNLGISQDRIIRATEGVSKQLKIFGLDAANANSVMYQFGQAVGLGVARTEELKQIMEASPQFVKIMAEQFGKTTTQFMADVAAQKVGAEDLIAAQERMADTNMWAKYQKTVGDSLTTVTNNFQIMMGRMESSTGIFSKVAGLLDFMGKNMDLVTAAGVAFFTVFSIKKIIDLGVAFATLNGVMKANPWVLLATVLLTAGSALVAYLGVSKEAEKVLKAESDAQDDLNKKVLEYKGPQVDLGALTTAAEQLGKQQTFLGSIAGLSKLRQEQEKAIFDFAQKQNIAYEKIPDSVKKILREQVAQRQQLEISEKINQDLMQTANEIMIIAAQTTVEQEKLRAVERLRATYGQEIADQYRDQVSKAAELRVIATEHEKIDFDRTVNFRKLALLQLNLKELTTQEALDREKIYDIEMRTGVQLSDKARQQIMLTEATKREMEYRKTIAQNLTATYMPQQGLAAAATASGQMGQLDPIQAAITQETTLQNGLKLLREQGFIDAETYEIARVNAHAQSIEQMMAAEEKMFYNRRLSELASINQQIFGAETLKQIAAESAKFQMKSDAERFQFGIEQSAQMFSALGAQNKRAFEAAKAFNIANAIMNTYMAATKALATYPFPFGAIAAAAAVAMGFAQIAQIRSQTYSGRALGGPVMGGTPYLVGESGPEMFVPNTTGSITRNGDLGGGGAVNVTFNIMANDTAGFDDLLLSRKGLIRSVISDAMLESGRRG